MSLPSRVCLCLALLSSVVFSSSSYCAEYFVAPDGNDDHSGTLDAPFRSVQKASELVKPGDYVWLRGGTYRVEESQIAYNRRGRAYVVQLDKNGEANRPIRFWAYPSEQPVLDFSDVKPRDARITAFRVTGSWIHVKGITVTGVQVTILKHTQSICFDNQGSHNIYEQLTMRDGQAIGFWLGRGAHNLVLNCDAYQNHDFTSEGGRGGNVDGFGFHAPRGSVGNVFRGCRAWFNSDDGFDFITTAEPVTVEDCWALYNGYDRNFKSLGDGTGFKAGGYAREPASRIPDPVPRHVIRKCLAVRNKASGFYANHQPGGADWINNTAFKNGINFNMLGRDRNRVNLDVDGFEHLMRNNLGFRGRRELLNLNREKSDVSHNYFDLPVDVTSADFKSVDERELIGPRLANGDLPKVSFMHLVAGSDLIDCGIDVGLPFGGEAPDLGTFEFEP
jgi:hypothetical protein